MKVPLGRIVNVGDSVKLHGVESVVASRIENEIATDDLLTLYDGRTCWASELDAVGHIECGNHGENDD